MSGTSGRWRVEPQWDVDDTGPQPSLRREIALWNVVTREGDWADCFSEEWGAQQCADNLNRAEERAAA